MPGCGMDGFALGLGVGHYNESPLCIINGYFMKKSTVVNFQEITCTIMCYFHTQIIFN
jgi:hypothetical protein